MRGPITATGVRATTLTPFHYHSLAVQSGTATLATYLGDRAMAFALGAALGALSRSVALPDKDYGKHLRALPCLASLFEAEEPRLLRPIGKRLNLDGEGGYPMKVQEATSTGNLKTWFHVQEVPPGVVYRGAFFGADPFALIAEAEGREPSEIVVRVGRHLGGIVRLVREPIKEVRLNAHTASFLGYDVDSDPGLKVDVYAMHDMQVTGRVPLDEAVRVMSALS